MLKEIPANTNLLINDTLIPDGVVRETFYRFGQLGLAMIDVLNCYSLSQAISPYIRENLSSNTAVLLPGNGSQSMLAFFDAPTKSSLKSAPAISFPCQRDFNGSAFTGISMDLPNQLVGNIQEGAYSQVLVIDDVCARGNTIQAIKKGILSELEPPLPPLVWKAIFWLNYYKSNTQGFACQAAIDYKSEPGSNRGLVPVNSLSTLLEDSGKGSNVRASYANKYFPGQDRKFISALLSLRKYG